MAGEPDPGNSSGAWLGYAPPTFERNGGASHRIPAGWWTRNRFRTIDPVVEVARVQNRLTPPAFVLPVQVWVRQIARRTLILLGVTLVLMLTVWSAILVKQSRGAAPLMAGLTTIRTPGFEHTPDTTIAPSAAIILETPAPASPEAASPVVPVPRVGPVSVKATKVKPDPLTMDPKVRWFNGRAVRPVRKAWMTVTAYSPDARSCGESADGRTATMHSVTTNGHALVAADPRVLPYGSMISVPGYDLHPRTSEARIVPVLDCGGAIKGNRLDVLMPTHEQARRWGVRRVQVTIWGYADGSPRENPRTLR